VKRGLLPILRDPMDGSTLSLEGESSEGDEIVSGLLRSPRRSYPIRDCIARMVVASDAAQEQTAESFGFKWKQRHTYDSDATRENATPWLIERYGFRDAAEMSGYFARRRRILDAGCGGGFTASIMFGDTAAEYVGVDISEAVDEARRTLAHLPNASFVQGDLMALPFAAGSFDTALAEGTLHHTPSTERALESVVSVLAPGGEILFYVYRIKAPAREFTDDHVRAAISGLSPSEAWAALRPLTRMAQALTALGTSVTIPEDVPYLGIRAGTYDVQRFLYGHFVKIFWNDALSFEENNHVNFDWFHPRYAHRQSEREVMAWCERLGLDVMHMNVQESGITVRAVKR
jgi:arsenite methyltransferase